MGGAGIIDDLVREEELRIIVCQRLGLIGLWHPLKEEDEAVNRSISNKRQEKFG